MFLLLKRLQFSYDCGIGFKLQNKEKYEKFTTIPYEYICGYNQNKLLSEEMRLLYVALTRAKERLFITVNTAESEVGKAQEYAADIYMNQGITESLVSSAKSMGDWLLMTLLSHRKSGRIRAKKKCCSLCAIPLRRTRFWKWAFPSTVSM